jgi:uncharacterized protein (DUF1697 family)
LSKSLRSLPSFDSALAVTAFVALLRGVNVGGKNRIAMSDVSASFAEAGYVNVRTHGHSGNVLFESEHAGGLGLESKIEQMLHDRFEIPIVVVIRSDAQLAAIVAQAPADHGSDRLRSEVFFVKDPLTAEAAFVDLPELRAGVDSIAMGPGVLYFSRVAAQATKTRVQRVLAMPMFKQMTVRTWGVTTRLLDLLHDA